jgi:hypothetical protein
MRARRPASRTPPNAQGQGHYDTGKPARTDSGSPDRSFGKRTGWTALQSVAKTPVASDYGRGAGLRRAFVTRLATQGLSAAVVTSVIRESETGIPERDRDEDYEQKPNAHGARG